MTSIKDRIVEAHRYNPDEATRRRAARKHKGPFTVKKEGDLLFDEKGRCYQIVGGKTVPYDREARHANRS